MIKKQFFKLTVLFSLFLLVACGGEAEPTPIAAVTEAAPTEAPTAAPTDTAEPEPTETNTPAPTATTEPTETPAPTATNTPAPTATDEPEAEAAAGESGEEAEEENTPKPTRSSASNEDDEEDEAEEGETEAATTTEPAVTPDSKLADLDGLALIQTAEETSRAQETFSMSQVVIVSAPGVSQSTTQTCLTEIQEQAAYCEALTSVSFAGSDPITSTIEVIQIGQEMWLREADGAWEEFPPELMEGFDMDNLTELKLSDFMTEAQVVREMTLEGVASYQIDYVLDVNAYLAFILGEEAAAQMAELSTENEGAGSLWIAIEEELPLRTTAVMTFLIEGEELITEVKANYYDYNEPVEIPDPTVEDA